LFICHSFLLGENLNMIKIDLPHLIGNIYIPSLNYHFSQFNVHSLQKDIVEMLLTKWLHVAVTCSFLTLISLTLWHVGDGHVLTQKKKKKKKRETSPRCTTWELCKQICCCIILLMSEAIMHVREIRETQNIREREREREVERIGLNFILKKKKRA